MKTFAILGAALALATLTIDTAEARGGRFVRENPAGGVTAGFVINAPRPHVLRLAPPLIVPDAELDRFVEALPGLLGTP